MLRGVCFDLDDTLCTFTDAERAARLQVTQEAADHYGLPVDEVRQRYRAANSARLSAPPFDYWVKTTQMAYTIACWAETLEPLCGERTRESAARWARRFLDVRLAALRLYEDALPVLQVIGARFPLAVISNGPLDNQRREAEHLGLMGYFQAHCFEAELGRGKPDPTPFRQAAQGLGCRPDELLHVGDSYTSDVAGARSVGAVAVWLRRESAPQPPACDREQGVWSITSLGQLPLIVAELAAS
ncbi:MAG TPA: HAD family hydrolase [Limnochordia bacterium]|nr:HAD family hydrolase [Limnochordia bacterium]